MSPQHLRSATARVYVHAEKFGTLVVDLILLAV